MKTNELVVDIFGLIILTLGLIGVRSEYIDKLVGYMVVLLGALIIIA